MAHVWDISWVTMKKLRNICVGCGLPVPEVLENNSTPFDFIHVADA